MFDDEDSFFRRPEIMAVLGMSLVVFLLAMLLVVFNASSPHATNATASSPAAETTTTTTFVDAAQQALYGDGTTATTTPDADITSASSNSFGVRYNGNTYICVPDPLEESSLYDCTLGSTPQSNNIDLYCSGERTKPACSPDWYPSRLQSYRLRTIDGSHYLCAPATSVNASPGDEQCARYPGGDPVRVPMTNGLKCSPSGTSVVCNEEHFPSELNRPSINELE